MALDKEKLRALATKAEVFARERWRDFRENSVYFQLKAGLVVGYAVIVVATLVLAPPAAPSYKLRVETLEWGLGQRTMLELQNLKLGTLSGHIIEVQGTVVEFDGKAKSGTWRAPLRRLSEGDSEKLSPEKLLSAKNVPAGDNLTITRVRVYPKDDPDRVVVDGVPETAPR